MENRLFKLAWRRFSVRLSTTNFFFKTEFFCFKIIKKVSFDYKRTFFVTAILLFIICLGGTKENHRKRNHTHLFCDVIKLGGLVEMYPAYKCSDSGFSRKFRFITCIFQGQLGSSEVKLGPNPSNRDQIGSVGQDIPNIHLCRLRILSGFEIQNYLLNQAIKSHQRSTGVKLVKKESNCETADECIVYSPKR